MKRPNVSRRRWIWVAASLCFSMYVGLYIWARCSGLFGGAVQTWAPFGRQPTNQYMITPIGWHSVLYFPDDSVPEQETTRLNEQLAFQKRLSLRLWPWYSWLAALEELCRRRSTSPNHALQRTRSAVTLAASSHRLSPAMQPARQLRESLSLGSLGVSSRLV